MTAMTGTDRVRDGSCYFQRSRFSYMLLIGTGLILLGWLTLSPATIPYHYMPAVGDFLLYIVKNYHTLITYAFWGSLLIHIVEAFYCIRLCESKGITDPSTQFQWFIQTILFGYASFGCLMCYQPPAKKYY